MGVQTTQEEKSWQQNGTLIVRIDKLNQTETIRPYSLSWEVNLHDFVAS